MGIACLAAEAADLTLLDPHLPWEVVVESGLPVVLHDPLCPLTPVEFLVEAVDAAEDATVVGVRPVTDTVRASADGGFGELLDRDGLWQLASPIVIPAAVVAKLDQRPPIDFAESLSVLGALGEVRYLEAPPLARRITDTDGIRVLEALGR